MKRYWDPKNDLVFRRVFGEHPEILRAFLNAILPLEKKIISLEYLAPEQFPEIPILKQIQLAARCKDEDGQQFIVAIQISWTTAFLRRVRFHRDESHVQHLEKKEQYKLSEPVMGLCFLNDIFDLESENFYHHYKTLKVKESGKTIEGLELVLVELPKFSASSGSPERIAWLRYLIETGERDGAPENFAGKSAELKAALEGAELYAFSRRDEVTYEAYWDIIRTEKSIMFDSREEVRREHKKGILEGHAKARREALKAIIAAGFTEADAKRILKIE